MLTYETFCPRAIAVLQLTNLDKFAFSYWFDRQMALLSVAVISQC